MADKPGRDDASGDASTLAQAIERLLAAGIGMTAWAIGHAPGAETLTLVQWRVLVIAAKARGTRIGELAAQLGVSVPAASRLVRRMEARGLVRATRDEEDRRATVVSLTELGRSLVEDVISRRRALIDQALRDRRRRRDRAATETIEEIAARLSEFI